MKSSFLAAAIFLIVATYSAADIPGVFWMCVRDTYLDSGSGGIVDQCEDVAYRDSGGQRDRGCCANTRTGDGDALWAYARDGIVKHSKKWCPYCFGKVKMCTERDLYAEKVEDHCIIL